MDVGSDALTNAVVGDLLGDAAAAENVLAMRVDGGATEAGGAARWVEDFEVKLAFEFNDEDVIASAVGWITPGHADERVGCGGDEKFVKILSEVGRGNGRESGALACAGGLAYSVTHALEGARDQVVVEGVSTSGWCSDLGDVGEEAVEVLEEL